MHLVCFHYKNKKNKFRGSDSRALLHEQESSQAMVRFNPSPEQLQDADQTHITLSLSLHVAMQKLIIPQNK